MSAFRTLIFPALIICAMSIQQNTARSMAFRGLERASEESSGKTQKKPSKAPFYIRYMPGWMGSFMGYKNPAYNRTFTAKVPQRKVQLKLPRVKTQDDDWSCGVNSSTRVLKYYGHNVTYDQLRNTRKKKFRIPLLNRLPFARGSVPLYRLGTRPNGVRDLLNIYRRGTRVETETRMARILELVRLKKPVVTLVRPNDLTRDLPFGKTITLPALHWIVVSGFDEDQKKIYFYDTNVNYEKSYTYEQFMHRWNWSHRLFKTGLRFKPRTIVY